MKSRTKKIILISSISTVGLLSIAGVTSVFVIKSKAKQQNKNNHHITIDDDKENKKEEKVNKEENTHNEQPKNNDEPTIEKEIIDSSLVFPSIDDNTYYDHLNFKDSNAWIDDEMIAFVIKDIISKLIINDGEIKYAYNRIAQNDVEISFIWENDTQKAFRTYKICTNNI